MAVLPDKTELAKKVRDLRLARRWTQSELANQLGLSQNRLSEIERGAGSFTAEQFLAILSLFNVTTDFFVSARPDQEARVQNALARLGAAHLRERDDVLPSERLREAETALREVLVAPESPRLLTALAPVLVENLALFQLPRLALSLRELGLEHRLGWLIENTLVAIDEDLPKADRAHQRLYRRALVVLRDFIDEWAEPLRDRLAERSADVLDTSIRSSKTLAQVKAKASPISQRWAIASELTPGDFADALRGARAAD
ncbi:MAG TPA: helix-turn-helix transcriptional regulator [Polyangiales bacterium]|nr:helix-turn-helix transcriptional regulator [Polyangiales bacterium]